MGTDSKIQNKAIWSLLWSVSLDFNWGSFHKCTSWYRLSQFLDLITLLQPQYLGFPPPNYNAVIIDPVKESLIHTFQASIPWERNAFHFLIHCNLAAGLLISEKMALAISLPLTFFLLLSRLNVPSTRNF